MINFYIQSDNSIYSLNKNTPIQYMGYEIGKVQNITLSYDKKSHKIDSHITLSIDTQLFKDKQNNGIENFSQAVRDGLSAKIIETNPITKSVYMDLIFDKNYTRNIYDINKSYIRLIEDKKISFDELLKKTDNILSKIDKMDFEAILLSMNKLLKDTDNLMLGFKKPVDRLDRVLEDIESFTDKKTFKDMPNDIQKSLKTLTKTLKTTNSVIKGYRYNSLFTQQLSQVLQTINKTAQEMTDFLEMLNRKPNSLIFGDK